MTTIPYDKGWTATLDGKEVPITAFQDGFISVTIPSGSHHLELSFLPQGFVIGVFLFFGCIALFILFAWFYQKQVAKKQVLAEQRQLMDQAPEN